MLRLLALSSVVFLLGNAAAAVPVASNLVTEAPVVFGAVGQSFTVVAPGPVSNIVINFFSDTPATIPSALGNAFLLSSAYLGNASALSGATPGFLGQAAAAGGFYTFNPLLTLLPGVQYFVYTDNAILASRSNLDPYAGGNAFVAPGGPNLPYVSAPTTDAAFVVDGTFAAVGAPEIAHQGAGLALSVMALFLISLRRQSHVSRG